MKLLNFFDVFFRGSSARCNQNKDEHDSDLTPEEIENMRLKIRRRSNATTLCELSAVVKEECIENNAIFNDDLDEDDNEMSENRY